MKPLGVAMVAATSFPANHGSPASIREMSQELSRRGHRVHVVTYHWKQDIPVEGITIHRTRAIGSPDAIAVGPTKERPLYDALLTWELVKTVRREELDVIHAHNYEGAMAGWIAKVLTGRPVIFNSVTNMEDELPTYRFLRPEALARRVGRVFDQLVPRMADHLTTVTYDLRDQYIAQGLSPRNVSMVPPGVHPEWFDGADGGRVRRELALGDAPVVIYTGVLNRFQGLEYLLKGFRTVRDSLPEARLLLMGNIVTEHQERWISTLARRLGIWDAMVLAYDRPLGDLPDFLAAADVGIVPRPNSPGFPVKLLNYMSARLPVVSAAGSAKCLTDGVNGMVVPNADGEAIGRAALELLRNSERARTLGVAGRETVEGRYQWSAIAAELEAIYARVLDLPADRRAGAHREAPAREGRRAESAAGGGAAG